MLISKWLELVTNQPALYWYFRGSPIVEAPLFPCCLMGSLPKACPTNGVRWWYEMYWDVIYLLCFAIERLCGSAPEKKTPDRSTCNVGAGSKKSTAKRGIYWRWIWWTTQKRSESTESRVGSPRRIFNARPNASHSRRGAKFSKERGGEIFKTHCRETLTCIEGYGSSAQVQTHQAGHDPYCEISRNDFFNSW